ncbi:hypothetical protein HWV62_22953 [Athelia sp. TMB]|nr:hypothetical protein HWV62_22953 [Athelia sp. TMB]
MMLASPSSDYIALRPRDSSLSPSCRAHHGLFTSSTPPRPSAKRSTSYDSPMLTPSPLRRQSLFPSSRASDDDYDDDIFLQQSPFRPVAKPVDDDGLFLAPKAFPGSAQPLRTPVKQQARRKPSLSFAPAQPPALPLTLGGTKRKGAAHDRLVTPLGVSAAQNGAAFDRLAPLPAPRFDAHTPAPKDADGYARTQESMTRLRICDLDNDNDSDDDEEAPRVGRKPSLRESLLALAKARGKAEVAEAVSPGGHVSKRRARSRPVSEELLESVRHAPSPSPAVPSRPRTTSRSSLPMPAPISFPRTHTQASPAKPGRSPGKTLPRRRISNHAQPARMSFAPPPVPVRPLTSIFAAPPTQPSIFAAPAPTPTKPQAAVFPARAPMERLASSATLFFGPAIPTPTTASPPAKSPPAKSPVRKGLRVSISSSGKPPRSTKRPAFYSRPSLANRHSYAGTRFGAETPSPRTCLSDGESAHAAFTDDEEELEFFGAPHASHSNSSSSFIFSVTENTPSPRRGRASSGGLAVKYQPRDSGVVMSDDGDDEMPPASTSVGSLYSDPGAELLTPGAGPEGASGWPSIAGEDERAADIDAFIRRTLAAGAGPGRRDSDAGAGAKRAPGTPKKGKAERPWQSAVAAKVARAGFGIDLTGKKGRPRQSMPAAFAREEEDEESGGETDSPSFRREARYAGLGLGKPRAGVRRSSSGVFEVRSTSGSGGGTPTKLGWGTGRASRIPLASVAQFAARSASGSSTSSQATLHSPSTHRHLAGTPVQKARPVQRAASGGRFERDFVDADEVGAGQFGTVQKVRYQDGRPGVFAVKKSKTFEGARHRLRLREEVDILQHLAQASARAGAAVQPNVLAYVDSWEQDDALYIQTELCALGNLARFLWEYGRAFPRLDEARVWKIFADLSGGLRFVHEAGVIHLDLKPENVFVTAAGRFKLGDFGMASLWPRPGAGAFEREGDKVYLAPEILQGRYGKEADIFSLGITMLETASNIVVPDQGPAWHQLRQEDFSQVELGGSPELLALIRSMMRTDPARRVDVQGVAGHPVVARARAAMERALAEAEARGAPLFGASPLAGVPASFLAEILGRPAMPFDDAMDLSP